MSNIARYILGLHGVAALAIVFALPLLESSAFVGLVFPGEIAVLLGGVLAAQHRVNLAAVLTAAILGAVLGDTIGYAIGHSYGRRLLSGRLGRLVKSQHRDRAERYLAERGGPAVFLGRFTAALRVLIPGLAGMGRMPYRTFAAYNVAGGITWASTMVLLGYLAGASWQRAAGWASGTGLALLALIALAVGLRLAVRASRCRVERLRALGDRLAATTPARWAQQRLPLQVAWLRRRLDPATPTGLALTGAVTLAVILAWTFGGLTQDVLAGEGLARLDPRVHAFAVAHRTGWLTAIMANVTLLGSNWLLPPVLLAATGFLLRGRRWADTITVWVAYSGAVALYRLAKPLVHRPRPPATDLIEHVTGLSYPSGHTTQATTAWAVLAVVLLARCSARARTIAIAAAALVILLVGASRIYLGAHWLTDVLAGYLLAGAWLSVLAALRLRQPVPTSRSGTTLTRPWRASPTAR